MRRKYLALAFALLVAFAFLFPILPSGAVATPPPCGPPGSCPLTGGVCSGGVRCRATEMNLISITHALFGVGGYFWELNGNGTIGFQWRYGFDF